jgi:hypothetical protein
MEVVHSTGDRALDEEINRILARLDKLGGKNPALLQSGVVSVSNTANINPVTPPIVPPVVGGVDSLNALSGAVTLSGSGGITMSQVGQNIDFSAGASLNNTWTPVLFAQSSGSNIPANAMLVMNSATD